MALDVALNPEDLAGGFEEDDDQSEVDTAEASQAAKRELKRIQKQQIDAAKKKAAQLIAKKVAQQGIVRSVALACGSTGVGLIVTYLIWTLQAIVANLLGHDKIIPKLEWWELILWGILTLLLIFLSLILLVLFIVAAAISNPILGVTLLGAAAWNWITGL